MIFVKLGLEKMKEIAHGAVEVKEENGRIAFYRFTKEQQLLYKNLEKERYLKTFTPALIRLVFKTDSGSLFLKFNVPFATSRSYFSVDVYVNNEMIGNIDNFSGADESADYTQYDYPIGNFEKAFDLGSGEKTVSVYLPWSVPLEMEEMSIDDGSYAVPIPRDRKIMIFGDSIAQGYDGLHPSKHYGIILGDLLDADVYNKAIGGDQFIPSLVDTSEDFVPEYIIVAYGTNDWCYGNLETFRKDCRDFFEAVSKKYSSSKIFAITPIWRKNYEDIYDCGTFLGVSDYIEETVSKYDNVFCVRGFDLVPHKENLFGDLRLHPNDEGFCHYANNLYNAIKNHL